MAAYDYSYELTDEQLLRYSALPAEAELRWLDEAWRLTLLGREARRRLGLDVSEPDSRTKEPV